MTASPGADRFRLLGRGLGSCGLVLIAYFVAGRIGLAVPYTNGVVSPVWPAAGVAVAALLLRGPCVWPGVTIGAFLVNFFTPVPILAAAVIAVGNTVGPLAGTWLLRRRTSTRILGRPSAVLRFIVLAAFGGTALSATIGTAVLSLAGAASWSSAARSWMTWWVGDAMGVLIVAPLALTLPGARKLWRLRPGLELAGLLAVTVACSALVFHILASASLSALVLLTFPFLVVWGATRFEVVGASLVTFCITAVAVMATGAGDVPVVGRTLSANAALLQSFLAVIAVSGLSIAAQTAERTRLIREQAAREGARHGDARVHEMAETANEGVWMLDSRLLTSFVNPRMAALLGWSVAEMLGKPLTAFMFEEDVAGKHRELERRQLGVSERLENRLRRKDGSEVWARVSTTGSFDAEGRFTGVLAMVSDITEEKRHEAEGKAARHELLLLTRAMEQTGDSVVVTDKRGVIEYVNPAFESTTGYSRDEVIGQTPALLKSGHHGADFYQNLWGELLQGRTFRGTLVNRKKRGDLYWAEQTISPVRDDGGEITHFVSVLKDVTERRRQHAQEVQLRLAREVQQRFYQSPVRVPGLDLAAVSCPATETGGDYFDFIPAGSGCVYVAVGDASGHGLGAALVMAMTRAYVRSFAALHLDVGEIVTRVNAMLVPDLEDNRFVTLLLTHVDAVAGRLTYANAGHVPGFLLAGAERQCVEASMESTGPPMGIFDGLVFPSVQLSLEVPNVVLLVTDGVTESGSAGESDEEFGVARLLASASARCNRTAEDIARGVSDAARQFAGAAPQADDMTSVVVKVTGRPAPAGA